MLHDKVIVSRRNAKLTSTSRCPSRISFSQVRPFWPVDRIKGSDIVGTRSGRGRASASSSLPQQASRVKFPGQPARVPPVRNSHDGLSAAARHSNLFSKSYMTTRKLPPRFLATSEGSLTKKIPRSLPDASTERRRLFISSSVDKPSGHFIRCNTANQFSLANGQLQIKASVK